MSDRLSELEARVAELAEGMRRMEARLDAVESGVRLTPAAARRARAAAAVARDATVEEIRSDATHVAGGVALVGRTLLVLAGAFVLRALTDSGTLPDRLGAGLGFLYAGAWIGAGERAAKAGRGASAAFHGAAAVMIGFPLLFEAVTKFRILSPLLAAVALAGFTGVALAVAAWRRFEVLAWLVGLGGVFTALALMFVTRVMVPPLAYLLLLGTATLWLGYVRDWHGLRWPVAGVADLAVLVLGVRAVNPDAVEGPGLAMALQISLVALYLGSIAVRTLLLDRDIVPFEVAQAVAVLVAGLGGAAFVAARADIGAGFLGTASVLFGLASYGVAFAFVERRRAKRRANFYFYTSVALLFVLLGTAFVIPAAILPAAWALFALAAAGAARWLSRRTLATHAAAYAVAALASGGLFGHAFESIFASPELPWTGASASGLLAVLAAAAAAWITTPVPVEGKLGWLPRFLLLAALAATAAGVLAAWVVPLAAGTPGAGARAGDAATARTAVLVGGAILLALLGRVEPWKEARWLSWTMLAVVGVKILVEDLQRSRPATLFLAFALYGGALIVVPRLRRREKGSPAAGPAGSSPAGGTPPERSGPS